MGRGIAYIHQYFMLFDYDHFYFKLQLEDEFLESVANAFGTSHEKSGNYIGRNLQIIAETDRLEVGIDSSGGIPCIFAQPKTYVPWNAFGLLNEKEYNIRRDVIKAFSHLIKLYNGYGKKLNDDPMFRYPTSAWTSSPYVHGKFVA